MLKAHYQHFFHALGDSLHVLAHSHHPWPDVSREAQLAYWDDSVRLGSRKWEKILGQVVSEAQSHVARLLKLSHPELIAFAPNTHEFVARLYSCLDWSRPVRVLTTDSEFHSFDRQTRRLEETRRLQVQRIAAQPYASFSERFRQALDDDYDLVFLSQVFYDSGFLVQGLEELLSRAASQTMVCIDGYHAFCALSVDLSQLEDRVFYLAGGYKYAQAGEGVCFMSIPSNCALRPIYTGWFADTTLDAKTHGVNYSEGALRFWGSTFDASGLYRFNAVMRWLHELRLTPMEIHKHVSGLQEIFINGLTEANFAALPISALTPSLGCARGNFCSFTVEKAERMEQQLQSSGILIDRRDKRLRFGFGLYHDEAFVDALLARLHTVLG